MDMVVKTPVLLRGIFLLLMVGVLCPAVPAHGPDEDSVSIWGCPMCESVRTAEPGSCPTCKMALVDMSPAARARNIGRVKKVNGVTAVIVTPDGVTPVFLDDDEGSVPLMPGAPAWIFYATSITILLVSFLLLDRAGRKQHVPRPSGRRWDVLELPGLRRLLKRPASQFALQIPIMILFTIVMFAGLFGNPDTQRNIAPVMTWTLWWTWLIFVVLFMGKIWCTVCPWMAIADWIARSGKWLPSKRRLGLNKPWPKRLRNIWLAIGLFLLLTWLELGVGVTKSPFLTAVLGLAMVAMSIATVLIYERKAFCRYACLVGWVSGLYAMFGATELRAKSKEVCRTCQTNDCLHGNDKGIPCPTTQYMGSMQTNTYCTLCLECVKTCPSDNIAFNVRPFGADLVESPRPKMDEAALAVIMLSMSAFHGFSMTPSWETLVDAISKVLRVGWLVSFSISMATVIILPLLLYYGICKLMRWSATDNENSTRTVFIKFAYALLPIALFYHLAHNLQHIFYEGKRLIRIASDPFGWGWDLFGTSGMLVDAVLPLSIGWGIQVCLIIIGHIAGIVIAHKVALKLYGHSQQATFSQIPMLIAMLLFSFQSLWLISQPMVMRSAM